MKRIYATGNAPAAIGPYSQGVEAGGFFFVSGQLPLQPNGTPVGEGIEEQTVQVLKNLKAILVSAGYELKDVVKTTIFLRDLADFNAFNQVYSRFFLHEPPARVCIQAAALPRAVGVEIEAIACRRDD